MKDHIAHKGPKFGKIDFKIDFKKLFKFSGPAYLIGIGYMDPGNWATDLAGGSSFEFKLVWVLAISNILALFLQSLCTRFGIVTGLDLATASRKYYPRGVNFILYLLAEIAITACELAEIIGMAIGLKLLFGLPLIWGIYITFLDTLLIFFLMGKNMKRMELFIIGMISIISVSFILELTLVKLSWIPILKGFIPAPLKGNALFIALGIIGATVMPHNLYLHSHLVKHHHKNGNSAANSESIKYAMVDTGIALNIAFFVNLSIILLAALAFHSRGLTHVAELEDAHTLLKKILGSTSSTLFGIALLAAGQSSTITGTMAGQIIMEGYLELKVKPWIRRLITRGLALIPATLTIYFTGEKSLNSLLILSQIVLSGQLCFAIIPLIQFNSFKGWMGDLVLSKFWVVFGWLSILFILSFNGYYLFNTLSPYLQVNTNTNFIVWFLIWLLIFSGISILLYLILEPLGFWKKRFSYQNWLISDQENK